MAEEVKGLVDVLATGGPYAIMVFLGWAYWSERAYTRELHQELLKLATGQVAAMGALKTSVDGLEKTMGALAAKL